MPGVISRRQFVLGAAGAALLAECGRLPFQEEAPPRIYRIGFLSGGVSASSAETVIDTTTNTVVGAPLPVGTGPLAVGIGP